MDLQTTKCKPCEGIGDKLDPEPIAEYLGALEGWEAHDDRLRKSYTFKNFVAAMAFVNRMAELAESEGHHPDFCVQYNKVDVTLWTHAIGGLSMNDFILAAKIDGPA